MEIDQDKTLTEALIANVTSWYMHYQETQPYTHNAEVMFLG